MKPI
jgi:hypothetical protein